MKAAGAIRTWLHQTWLHPRHLGAVYLRDLIESSSQYASGVMVDVGCGRRPYESFFRNRVTRYVGIDVPVTLDRAAMDVVGDARALPLRSGCADTVLATEVIEHVADFEEFTGEVRRVLRPGGVVILSAPFMEPLHEEPRDYFRFTAYGLRALLVRQGFTVNRVAMRGGWGSVVGLFVSQSVYDWANPADADGERHRQWVGFLVAPVCAAAQLAGYFLDRVVESRRYTLGYFAVATLDGTQLQQAVARTT